jgi:hypothetical protein
MLYGRLLERAKGQLSYPHMQMIHLVHLESNFPEPESGSENSWVVILLDLDSSEAVIHLLTIHFDSVSHILISAPTHSSSNPVQIMLRPLPGHCSDPCP